MNNSERGNFVDIIDVEMGECVVLDGESQQYLKTDGLGPCVGIAIVIKTLDEKVHRLLGHIVMEEWQGNSFEELKASSKTLKANTNNNVKSIDIQLVSFLSYRDFNNLTEDEKKLLNIIKKDFEIQRRSDIKFRYFKQVQISPEGLISFDCKKTEQVQETQSR